MYEFTVRPTPQGYVAVTITPTMDGRKHCSVSFYLALCAAPPE